MRPIPAGWIQETGKQERRQPCPPEPGLKPGTRGQGCARSNLEFTAAFALPAVQQKRGHIPAVQSFQFCLRAVGLALSSTDISLAPGGTSFVVLLPPGQRTWIWVGG